MSDPMVVVRVGYAPPHDVEVVLLTVALPRVTVSAENVSGPAWANIATHIPQAANRISRCVPTLFPMAKQFSRNRTR